MKDEEIDKVVEEILDTFDKHTKSVASVQDAVEVFGRVLGVVAAAFDQASDGEVPEHVFILKFAECTHEYGLYLQDKLVKKEKKEYKLPDTKKYKNN